MVPGGGEANVAISVANYGHEAYFVSKLPKHEIGQIAVNALRRYGVNTEFVARGGDRVGLYYAETGASISVTISRMSATDWLAAETPEMQRHLRVMCVAKS